MIWVVITKCNFFPWALFFLEVFSNENDVLSGFYDENNKFLNKFSRVSDTSSVTCNAAMQ